MWASDFLEKFMDWLDIPDANDVEGGRIILRIGDDAIKYINVDSLNKNTRS